jgi:hypothetical protein
MPVSPTRHDLAPARTRLSTFSHHTLLRGPLESGLRPAIGMYDQAHAVLAALGGHP